MYQSRLGLRSSARCPPRTLVLRSYIHAIDNYFSFIRNGLDDLATLSFVLVTAGNDLYHVFLLQTKLAFVFSSELSSHVYYLAGSGSWGKGLRFLRIPITHDPCP